MCQSYLRLSPFARRLAWLICGCLALAAVALGYRAMISPANAMVTVEWTTATELNTAGFNLYRSEISAGPFERVNEDLISASADPLVGAKYVFIDTGVVAGRTYYYQLEDVEIGGATTRHGPIQVKAERRESVEMLWAGLLVAGAVAGVMALTVLKR
jgi:hypothetical protein